MEWREGGVEEEERKKGRGGGKGRREEEEEEEEEEVYSKLTQRTKRWTPSATALPGCRRRDLVFLPQRS